MNDRDEMGVVSDDAPETSQPGTVRIGRFFGIDVNIHYTWLFAFALITYSLAVGYFPAVSPELSATAYWALGAIGCIGLFLAVLIHEYSHSLVARSKGLPVKGVTLFIFGGVSTIEEEAHDPSQEFIISFVGPLASFGLALLFWLIGVAFGTAGPFGALVSYLFLINLALGIFNLLPGYPLDGGRVLRAIIWAITGSPRQATKIAATVGQVFALILIAFGVIQILGGNFLGGLWIIFIGWFLNGAAESSQRQSAMTETFRGVRVRDVMTTDPPVVQPSLSVRSLIDDFALRRGARALLISRNADAKAPIAGIVTLTDVHKVPTEDWDATSVGEIMTGAPLISVEPDADLQTALRLMGERDLNQLPVMRNGELAGLLTRSGVIRFLQFREELGEVLPPTSPRSMPSRRFGGEGDGGPDDEQRAA